MSRPSALVVDDEPDIRDLLAMTLERMDIQAQSCADVASAKARLASEQFNLCLTDMRLPDGDGLELVEWIQAENLGTPVAVITAHGNVETAVRALKSGAFDFISKPVNLADLRKLVGSALKLEEPGATDTGQLLGESPAMMRLQSMIRRVARTQAPVHITGDSGTGKELVARTIHEQGPRASGPFVPVNCGAIPTELMESEFFGHRKGAFTGAVSDKQGLFQSAEGGTLFLDEIADLPLPMQVKLLRVIQEKTVRPIGQSDEIPVDVRVLSATHQDLEQLVQGGHFREDLFYRLHVIELHVPPLKDRGDDILILTGHILERLAQEMDVEIPQLEDDARNKLLSYAYPGNVRELENILERAMALCSGDSIGASDIQLRDTSAGDGEAADLGERLESVERDAILKALESARYNKTAAAKQLGLTLRALRYRMQKLGID